MSPRPSVARISRRGLLQGAVIAANGSVLVMSTAIVSAQSRTQAAAELRIAVASFANTLDSLKETNVLRFGVGETLMRLTPTYGLEPWLADHILNVDPLTWRVFLRPNARFHDGSPVTAADMVEAFARNYQAYPNGDR